MICIVGDYISDLLSGILWLEMSVIRTLWVMILPLGLGSLRCFQRLDDFGIPRIFGSVSIVFVDDVVIYFGSTVSHAHHLCILLEMFRWKHSYVKFSSAFWDYLM